MTRRRLVALVSVAVLLVLGIVITSTIFVGTRTSRRRHPLDPARKPGACVPLEAAIDGSPAAGNTPAVGGLATANVNLTVTFTNGVPTAMTVFISGYTIDSLFGTSALTNKPKVTFPYEGVWSPV